MEDNRVLEAAGDDVDDAIAKGLAQLGVSRDAVTIEILDEGSKGLLGFGRRDARIRIIVAEATKGDGGQPVSEDIVEADTAAGLPPASKGDMTGKSKSPAAVTEVETEMAAAPESQIPSLSAPEDVDEELADELEVAERVVSRLLANMQVDADLETRWTEPDDVTGRRLPVLDIRGKDLSVLIGHRGETLSSFQYIGRLMVSHELKRRTHFIVDVEGYRERRNMALERLSERMARKAVKRGKPVTLEPMPANERRMIHVSLRDHDQVYTESVGEGEGRRVRILLKTE